ncbi:MAG TPA: DNA adenine methylase [Pirellulales bacterium]|jgi:DNA adenine methylase|nr:DNA adenine methylase [Pirellulales bacterium]
MTVKKKTLRPPVKWHGGKFYLCHRIIHEFPAHHTYVEPFGGAASVLLNKSPASIEVYNDLDERITRLFRVLRDNGQELQRRLSLTPYSEIEFDQVQEPSPDEIEQVRRDFVRWRLSLGGRGDSFSFTLHRVRRGMADVVSGYLSTIDEQLPLITDRLRTVEIVRRPAIEVIRTWDSYDTLFYCDPPYVPSTRHESSRAVYGCEMVEADHRELAEVLKACKAKIVLSGYSSELYDDLYAGWRTVSFDIANHAAGGRAKARKQEVLWMNW